MKKHIPLFVCVILAFMTLCACDTGANTGTADTSTNTNTKATQSTPAPAAKHFKVGEAVTVGSTWKITVNSVKSDSGTQYIKPKAGNTFLLVDVSMTNISSKEQSASSALMWHLRDSTGQEYTETMTGDNKPPDGKVEAGSPLRGVLAYEVPAAEKHFTMGFEADLVSGGQTVWDLVV